jgi:hypothetical protein
VTRPGAVLRWRLATTAVSLRLVPPGLVLVVVLLSVFTQGHQEPGPVVATAAVILFGLAAWIGLAHAAALAPGHRAVTQVTVGRTGAFAGDLLSGAVLVAATAVVLLGWPVVVVRAVAFAGPGALVGGGAVVVVAGLTGLAAALVVDAFGGRAPVRFLAALALVSLTLARPALVDRGGPVGAVATVAVPAVLDVARAADRAGPPGGVAPSAACLAWTAGACAVAWWVRGRRPPGERAT